jgi:hypothetical protein
LIFEHSLRAIALLLVAGSSLAGLAFRISAIDSGQGHAQFPGLQGLNLRLGQPLGDAIFDGLTEESPAGLRLKLKQCEEPVIAAPMLLTAVAGCQVADRAYRTSPAILSTDVYHGRIRKGFTHFSRLIARGILDAYNGDDRYFVRFYAAEDCHVENAAYLDWAEAILSPGSKAGRAE